MFLVVQTTVSVLTMRSVLMFVQQRTPSHPRGGQGAATRATPLTHVSPKDGQRSFSGPQGTICFTDIQHEMDGQTTPHDSGIKGTLCAAFLKAKRNGHFYFLSKEEFHPFWILQIGN